MRTLSIIFFYILSGWSYISAQNAVLPQNQILVQLDFNVMYNEINISTLNSQEKKPSHWLIGGLVGLGAGVVSTAIVAHSGGSTALCNRSANQDALSTIGCAGLISGGGLVGGGIGILIGSFVKKKHGKTEVIEVKASALALGGVALGFNVSF